MLHRRRSLAEGAAVITVATAVSRLTGFLRVIVVAATLGTTFLANTYQTANTAPNVVFELVAAGILTSIFVPTFISYLVREERDEGWEAANALTSVALVGLTALALLIALVAPLVMRLLTIGVQDMALRDREIALGATFLRLFAPQVVFYGAGMIMTGALHAYRRFTLPALAPIFNNLVVIGVYVTYALMRGNKPPSVHGITGAETFLLGAGTTVGVIAMTLVLLPQLRTVGWRLRFRFDVGHPAVRKAARLGAWALGYAGGYQAGLMVVLLLANRVEGGVAAYQWAYTFFYVPHALFAVPIFHVLFPAMSEHVARGEDDQLLARLRDGLRMLAFILIPLAVTMTITAAPLATVTLRYGVMSGADAALVGRVIAAFAIGLPAYSAFLVFTRAYYAFNDTKTPTLVNAATVAVASVAGATLFALLGGGSSVPGLALGHSLAFSGGTVLLARLLSSRVGHLGGTALSAAIVRSLVMAAAAGVVMLALHLVIPRTTRVEALLNLVVTTGVGALVYLGGMKRIGSPELARVGRLVRRNARE